LSKIADPRDFRWLLRLGHPHPPREHHKDCKTPYPFSILDFRF